MYYNMLFLNADCAVEWAYKLVITYIYVAHHYINLYVRSCTHAENRRKLLSLCRHHLFFSEFYGFVNFKSKKMVPEEAVGKINH